MYKKMSGYFRGHPRYNGAVHLMIGVGVGALLTYPYFGTHPLRWGAGLIALGLAGHLFAGIAKK